MLNGHNLKKSWRVVVADTAKKHLKRIPYKDAERMEKVTDEMRIDPFSGDVVKFSDGGNRWRKRIGNYRIMYNILFDEGIVFIYDIRRRASNIY